MKRRIMAIVITVFLFLTGCTTERIIYEYDNSTGEPMNTPIKTNEATTGPISTPTAVHEDATDAPSEQTAEQPTLNPTEQPTEQPTDSPTEMPTPEAGGKTTVYQLYCVPYPDWQMMSYVIHTRNGKLIIIDGGADVDLPNLHEVCVSITGQEKPVVDAWLLTHCHGDHIKAFSTYVNNGEKEFTVNNLYYNFPDAEYIKQYEFGAYTETWTGFNEAMKKFDKNKVHVVQEGDKITVDNVVFEVLLTPDTTITSNVMNESSVVFRMNAEGQRIMFLGDLSFLSTNRFYGKCGSDFTCDIVQMAHHGSGGIPSNLYKRMKPKACLWPTPDWLFNNDNGGGYNSGPYETVELYNYLTDKCGVKKHFVAKDGLIKIELPMEF